MVFMDTLMPYYVLTVMSLNKSVKKKINYLANLTDLTFGIGGNFSDCHSPVR